MTSGEAVMVSFYFLALGFMLGATGCALVWIDRSESK